MSDEDLENEPLIVLMQKAEARAAEPGASRWFRFKVWWLGRITRRWAKKVGEEALYCRPSAIDDTLKRKLGL